MTFVATATIAQKCLTQYLNSINNNYVKFVAVSFHIVDILRTFTDGQPRLNLSLRICSTNLTSSLLGSGLIHYFFI